MIRAHSMRVYRRHAIVAILVLAAIITPPDVMSQLFIAIPLVLLYECSILIAQFVANRDRAQQHSSRIEDIYAKCSFKNSLCCLQICPIYSDNFNTPYKCFCFFCLVFLENYHYMVALQKDKVFYAIACNKHASCTLHHVFLYS